MFNISLADFTEHREERLEWYSSDKAVRLCIMKGLDEVSKTRSPLSPTVLHTLCQTCQCLHDIVKLRVGKPVSRT